MNEQMHAIIRDLMDIRARLADMITHAHQQDGDQWQWLIVDLAHSDNRLDNAISFISRQCDGMNGPKPWDKEVKV